MTQIEEPAGFHAAVWSSLPVPALLLDPFDAIAAVNPAAEQFLNASARSLCGDPVFDRVMIDAPLDEAFARVRSSSASLSINTVDVGGGARPPQSCTVRVAPVAGMPGHVLILLSPRELADRLGRAESVKSAARSAIGMSEMLAHEIKNPLAGITGAAQLLSMELPASEREMTDLIVSEARRILALLVQVEQFGNLRPPDRRPINVHDLLERARRSARVGIAAHMTITEDYDPSLPQTWVDADQMLQVLQNLLKNAAEAQPDGGTIVLRTFYDMSLRVRRKDGTAALPLQIEITDDGPGIPDNVRSDLFEPFVSGRENGTGLGLALVSKIISDHDGWISVDSIPGRTTFRISLPIASKTLSASED